MTRGNEVVVAVGGVGGSRTVGTAYAVFPDWDDGKRREKLCSGPAITLRGKVSHMISPTDRLGFWWWKCAPGMHALLAGLALKSVVVSLASDDGNG
jgi:hypothetical protein